LDESSLDKLASILYATAVWGQVSSHSGSMPRH
jgi:hypothetical protein